MASYRFPDNFQEDNSGPELTASEKDFLGFLVYQYGHDWTGNLPYDDETDEQPWLRNLEKKLES